MSRIAKLAGLLIVTASTFVGCLQEHPLEPVAAERAAEAAIPDSGFVPYPILISFSVLEIAPVLGNEGQYLPGWNGSVADLIAADAYALCTLTSPYEGVEHGVAIQRQYPGRGNDKYLDYLLAKIGEVACEQQPNPDLAEEQWHTLRTDRDCNLDPRSGKLSRIDGFQRNSSGYTSMFSTLDPGVWGLNGTLEILQAARELAMREVAYADLNLCMAQYMRDKVNSGQSLFTNSSDLTEMLGVIRERAQLASLYYAFLAKVASYEQASGSEPTTIVSARNDWLILLRHWLRDVATEPELTRIGEDSATAVRLAIQSTNELAAVLQRSAGQRPVGASGLSRADRDWGVGQPRIRLMNLLYGGDPIGGTDGLLTGGRGWGGTDRYSGAPPFVSADMSDSRIGTLIGLARAADAFYLKITSAEGGGGFDTMASAERLYQSVEVTLRTQRCEIQTPEAECDPADIRAELPPLDEFADYLLWQKHSVEPGVARRLTEALGQAFRELVKTFPETGRDGLMHLTGEHSSASMDGAEWLHVAPDFGMVPLAGHELAQDYARLVYLPERIVLEADPYDQGFSMHGGPSSSYSWDKLRELGAVPALAFIREALAEGGMVQGSRARFFEAAGVVLPELDREIGLRSVIVRPVLEEQVVTCPADTYTVSGADCQNLTQAANQYRVRSTTRGDDPLVELTLAPRSRQVNTVAIDADTVGYDEVTRSDLDSYPTFAGVVEQLGGYAAGYEQRAFSFEDGGSPARLLLRGQDTGSTNESIYMVLGDHWMNSGDSLQVSSGGELNFLGERTMQTLAHDWSRPAHDAFGLPADWVPPADASLVGGSPGEQSHTYYLRVARQAAEEATAAVQVAIDNLILETEQQVDLEAAEQRAETIAGIERASICGTSERCTDLYIVQGTVWLPVLGGCATNDLGQPLGSDAQAHCEAAMAARDELLPRGMRVTDEAYAAFRAGTPAFADYAGSELQGVLIRQWNAMTTLALVDAAMLSQARSLGTEFEAADAGLEAAGAEKVAAVEEVNDAIAALDAQALGIQGELDQLAAEESSLLEMYEQAEARMKWECSDAAMINAWEAGYSYSDAKGVRVNREEEWFGWQSYSSKSWSPGPALAQWDACDDATWAFEGMLSGHEDPETGEDLPSSYDARLASISSRRAALLARTALTDPEKETMLLRIAAAEAACDAATATAHASRQARWAQLVASLSEFQAAVAAVVASQAEFDVLAHRLEGVSAQEALEKDLANKEADARFGIQRKFRSYDMWRARALLESARRLAVAARKAVESHFVVDLSELDATQAFVESPALWADEIYGSDLDAPSVVGLSAAPKIEDAVYPNKLIDYVENLQRFVQGYTISYPTSLAEPDTEVLTLPGPDVREQLPASSADTSLEVVAARSTGWSFYCPASGAWLSNSGIGEHPLENSVARLCGSGDDRTPPARARYAFTLDPWGRLGGGIAFDPLEQRHNVRWSRLAVNLVGTGIRDCERASDPLVCYAEPFLRYDLKHVGPAWTTNYAEEWRAFNLPAALIEDGKALAAEEWLDPLTNSWNTPLVSNAARSELFGRSVGGSYVLELELGPEVQLKRIERVQLLVETRYWVRQE